MVRAPRDEVAAQDGERGSHEARTLRRDIRAQVRVLESAAELAGIVLERRRLADLRVDFLDETDAFFDTHAWPLDAWHERTPLMHEIRRDGVDI